MADGVDQLLPAGDYRLTISGLFRQAISGVVFDSTGDYQFRLSDLADATPIDTDRVINGTFDHFQETKLFRFDAQAGDHISWEDLTARNAVGDLIDPFGQRVFQNLGGFAEATLNVTGTYTLVLESAVIGPASLLDILRADAAAFILPDTHIAGGILPCITIGRICEAAGIPCIMHCGHDLGPKTAAMLHVAAACPAYSLSNDTTYYGLEDDIVTERFSIERGTIAVPNKPGLGIEGDPERLARYKVDC